jgi:hypothetical protein
MTLSVGGLASLLPRSSMVEFVRWITARQPPEEDPKSQKIIIRARGFAIFT